MTDKVKEPEKKNKERTEAIPHEPSSIIGSERINDRIHFSPFMRRAKTSKGNHSRPCGTGKPLSLKSGIECLKLSDEMREDGRHGPQNTPEGG